jgi:cytidylate kinase
MKKTLQIAIDGPVGAGKSTVARQLAERLGLWHLDTGAMYRAVAHLTIKEEIEPGEEEKILGLLKKGRLKFLLGNRRRFGVFLDGVEITDQIRSEAVRSVVTQIAQLAKVRKRLVGWQRRMVRGKRVVMEGRDIGTRVLPGALVKIFLTGKFQERAKRKYLEIRRRRGKINFEDLCLEIKKRDRKDRQRKIDPLRKAEDAVVIDTTNLNIEGVLKKIMEIVKERRKGERR